MSNSFNSKINKLKTKTLFKNEQGFSLCLRLEY